MKKLWQDKNKSNNKTKLVAEYCFKEGALLDNSLVPYDVYGSIAHIQMLKKIGIFSQNEFEQTKTQLLNILVLWKKNKFRMVSEDEDVHTKIENYLTAKVGNLGNKIHTARSRNDQVLVDLRIYAKEQLLSLYLSINSLIRTFVNLGKKYEFIPMPGYTHMQKAMPSSVGMWAGSFAESLIDDLIFLKTAFQLNDQSPLGTGAAYGVSLPVDRKFTADLLGFPKVQNNSLYTQVSRIKLQIVIMQSLSQIMLTLSRFAQDLLLFTTGEFNFFILDSDLYTGSSIMPQKNNLDTMEYLRAKSQIVINLTNSVATMSAGLPSGYNADFGEAKGPLLKSLDITNKSLAIVNMTVKTISPNRTILNKACTPELFATHQAYQLVKKGQTFREAYQQVKTSLNALNNYDTTAVLRETNHLGGPGNLGLKNIISNLNQQSKWWKKQKKIYEKTISKLIK